MAARLNNKVKVRIVETGEQFASLRKAELWIRQKAKLPKVAQPGGALRKAVDAARAFSGYTAEYTEGIVVDHDPRRFRRVGRTLGVQSKAGWYEISWKDMSQAPEGPTLLNQNGNQVLNVLRRYLPDVHWLEWLFVNTPHGFWQVKANRMRYMVWLCDQLGYRRPTQVMSLETPDFHAHHGAGVLRKAYASSPRAAVLEYLTWGEEQDG